MLSTNLFVQELSKQLNQLFSEISTTQHKLIRKNQVPQDVDQTKMKVRYNIFKEQFQRMSGPLNRQKEGIVKLKWQKMNEQKKLNQVKRENKRNKVSRHSRDQTKLFKKDKQIQLNIKSQNFQDIMATEELIKVIDLDNHKICKQRILDQTSLNTP